MPPPPYVAPDPDAAPGGACLLRVKVVPGASRSRIDGPHGDRLKVRIAAPPEKGRANRELAAVVAASLGLRRTDVTVVRGFAAALKTVRVTGLDAEAAAARLERPA